MSGYGYNQQPYAPYGAPPQQQSGPQYHPTQGGGYCPAPNQYGSPSGPQGGYVAGGYGAPPAPGFPSQNHSYGSSAPPPGGYQSQGSFGSSSSAPSGQQSGQTGDRGLMGAIAGGTAGGLLGRKQNHGFLGTIGGAIVGSLVEDKAKKSKKHGKW